MVGEFSGQMNDVDQLAATKLAHEKAPATIAAGADTETRLERGGFGYVAGRGDGLHEIRGPHLAGIVVDDYAAAVELHFGRLDTINGTERALNLAHTTWAAEIPGAKCGGFER